MSHQMLQSGYRDAGAHHFRAKGMAEPMWVGVRNLASEAMMAKQRAESGRSHSPPALAALEGNEQERGVGKRPFQPQILFQNPDHFLGQRQKAFLVAFPEDSHLGIGQLEIVELKSQDFARAHPIEQHQTHQGQIAEGAKAAPELVDFLCRERHNYGPRLP